MTDNDFTTITAACGHHYLACPTVAQHQDSEMPCPVCQPHYDYGQTHTIHRVVMDDGQTLLLCCGCFTNIIKS